MIDDFTIQRIKDAANIVDVMEELGFDLKKRGNAYECLCPFHDDRHIGSFKVSPTKNMATCFSCGWSGGPIDFLMEHEHLSYPDALRWLGKKYGIEVEGSENFTVKPSVPRPQLPPLPMLVLPQWMVDTRQTSPNATLVNWLITGIAWDDCQLQRLFDYLIDYHVGESKDGRTIWWQIDEQQRVRTGKLMKYKPDGHRDKDSDYNFDWVHSKLFRQRVYNEEEYDYETCLFGQHLLPFCPNAQIHLVESEKTALIMATYYGNMSRNLWLATGGLQFFDRKHIQVLIDQGRDIVVYPDKDGSQAWSERTYQLCKETGYNKLKVNPTIVSNEWREEDGKKADIADITIRKMTNDRRSKGKAVLTDMISENPLIGQLVEKLNLEVVDL